jgi:hypothetical protein
MALPTELILLATVHGGLMVDDNKQIQTFTIPDGITVTRVMATRPGICNVTTEEQINGVIKDMVAEGLNTEEVGRTVQSIRASQPEVVKNILGQLKGDDPNKELLQQFLRSRIATPTTKVFNPGSIMLDKYLTRDADEGHERAFDYKLNALNIPGVPDLFDVVTYRTAGPATQIKSRQYRRAIDLSVLVNILRDRGVQHLILYDLTCSSFMSNVPLTERDERALRRDIVQKGLGKRKTRRPKNKTKTRRGKKRTVSKWKD